jgi:hypothetical protein
LAGLLKRLLRRSLLGVLLLDLLATLVELSHEHPTKLGNLPLCLLLFTGARGGGVVDFPEPGKTFLVFNLFVIGEEGHVPHVLGPIQMGSLRPVGCSGGLRILSVCPARQALAGCWVHICGVCLVAIEW